MKKLIRALPAIAAAVLALGLLSACGANEEYLHEKIDEMLQPGDTFNMSELLYFSGDNMDNVVPGKKYEYTAEGGVTIIDGETGEATESHGGETVCGGVDGEQWLTLFPDGLAPDISGYEECYELQLTDSYRFYLMDDEIWIGVYDGETLNCLFKAEKIKSE